MPSLRSITGRVFARSGAPAGGGTLTLRRFSGATVVATITEPLDAQAFVSGLELLATGPGEAAVVYDATLTIGAATEDLGRFWVPAGAGAIAWSVLPFEPAGAILTAPTEPGGVPGGGPTPGGSSDAPVVYVIDHGVSGDGSRDDTEAVRAAHALANSLGRPVSYAGVATIGLRRTARIIVNTDVDWCGCIARAVDGIVATPTFPKLEPGDADNHTFFIVYDATTPRVTGTLAPTAANLVAGSRIATKDFFQGPGYAYIQSANGTGPQIAARDRLSVGPYRQDFAVNHQGLCAEPLSVDCQGITSLSYGYRATPAKGGRLRLRGLRVDPSTFNNQVAIRVERNYVTISDFMVLPPANFVAGSINSLLCVRWAAYVDFENIDATAQNTIANQGTYVISLTGAAEIFLDRVTALNGWGQMGSNHTNGLTVTRSTLNRIDAHAGGHNIRVRDSTLQDWGVLFGWGGGVLSVTGCTLINCPAIAARVDYGGYWMGSLEVADCHLMASSFSPIIIDLGSRADNAIGIPPAGAFAGLPVPMPSISIRSVNRTTIDNYNGSREIIPLHMKVRPGALVYAPQSVEISDINSAGDWRLRLYLDYENMRNDPIETDRARLLLRNCHPSFKPSVPQEGIYFPPRTIAGSDCRYVARIANCGLLVIEASQVDPDQCEIFVANSGLAYCATADTVNLEIQGGVLEEPALYGGATRAPIGGTRGNGRYGAIKGTRVRGAFDLSKIGSLSGVDIPNLNANADVLLPPGVTRGMALRGWHTGASFASDRNAQTGAAYTLGLDDTFKWVTMNNAALNTVTVPAHGQVEIPFDAWFDVIQIGPGATIIDAPPGVFLNGVDGGSAQISRRYGAVRLRKLSPTSWIISGECGPVA